MTKILVLSWEYPPRIIGGIARHVAELYPEIVQLNYEIHLVTVAVENTPAQEKVEGINIYRVPVEDDDNFFHWVKNMNHSFYSCSEKLIASTGGFELIHAHDWLVADSAIPLKNQFKIPLLTTIHATEYGRNNGIHNNMQSYISSQEGKLIYESWRVIVCTDYMRDELRHVFECPNDKIDTVYNGIRAEKKILPEDFDALKFRRHFAQDEENIIYYVGRMTYEKGIQVLVEAMPKIVAQTQMKTKCFIIGSGTTQHWQDLADYLNVKEYCHFTGFMSDDNLNKFTSIADCAVFPSLYEPFGIVVLESFASHVPVVVSDAGGLPEVVLDGQTGVVTLAKNRDSLAEGVVHLLQNPQYGKSLAQNAYQDLSHRFHWGKLAQQTVNIYDRIREERKNVIWE